MSLPAMIPVGIELQKLSAVFHHERRGDTQAVRTIDLNIRPGELLTLLGPSGCGKTTTLRMIAGFQEPSAGRILIGGDDVTREPANRRDIGLVFQSYALFPHLSVFENVAYGLRVRGRSADRLQAETREALLTVGLDGLDDRQINELSGGQQQRVALARAIVIRPRVLLFDEPLSNLDAKLRVLVRDEIAQLQRRLGITTVYVTHDQEEAMAISSRIALMKSGEIAQIGTAEELYRRPVSAFVAGFLGRANLVRGTIAAKAGNEISLATTAGTLVFRSDEPPAVGTRVVAVLRPEAIRLVDASVSGLNGVVVNRTYLGEKVEYVIRLGDDLLHVVQLDQGEQVLFDIGARVAIKPPKGRVQLVSDDSL